MCFIYNFPNKKASNHKPSVSGYGAFVEPKEGEKNQNNVCKQAGYWQYDFSKYLTFGTVNRSLEFSENETKALSLHILKRNEIGKIFIEPHLKQRLNLTSDKVRFHCCGAVRHDDHIHIQLK